MKNYSKYFNMLLMCALLFIIFTACGEEAVINEEWEVDKDNHWKLTQSGKKIDVQPHSVADEFCSICGAQVMDFGDEIRVQRYNEQGDACVRIIYTSEGDIIEHNKFEYTYDEKGLWDVEKIYNADGKLLRENDYATEYIDDQSFTYIEQMTTYNEDGTKKVETNDRDGWVIKEDMYKADGSLEYQYTVVNEFNEEGLIASIKKYDGEILAVEEHHEYDSRSNPTSVKIYEKGNLIREEIYITADGYIYMSEEIIYNEDGTNTIIEYDQYGK